MEKISKIKKLEQKWDDADKWVKRIIGAVSTLGVLAGMFMGLFNWGMAQLDVHFDDKFEALTAQIEALEAKSDDADRKLELSNTRLELSNLIAHSPENVIQIEMVARYYFMGLGGDWYMSGIYSEYAKEYGADTSFVTHK